jgi:hypothetical protein
MREKKISELNDNFRRFGAGNGQFWISRAVSKLKPKEREELKNKMVNFDTFTNFNDPFHVHDCGAIKQNGKTYLWKFDYYAPDMQTESEDPSDETKTLRILTLMRSDEY